MKTGKKCLRLELVAFLLLLNFNVFSQILMNDLLPHKGDLVGWINESVESFSENNLYDFIDGGADLYFEYGFAQAVISDYLNKEGVKIRCEIYRMTTDSSAYGIFTLNTTPMGQSLNICTRCISYDNYVELWKGNYFIRCVAGDSGKDNQDALIFFAGIICDKIQEEGNTPKLFGILKSEGWNVSNQKYVRGQIALNNVFNFGMGCLAGFSDGIIGTINDVMIFVFRYDNDHKCKEWFASAKGKMQMNPKYYDFKETEGGFYAESKKGESFSFTRQGRFILISKGTNPEESEILMNQIKSNVQAD